MEYLFTPQWNSPLIDRGDPGPRAPWLEQPRVIVNGRRDVGVGEYRFSTPGINLFAPLREVAVGTRFAIYADSLDNDAGDPLQVTAELDGKPVGLTGGSDTFPRKPEFERRFRSPGRHRFTAVVVDPIGLLDTDSVDFVVRRAAVRKLTLDRARMRAGRGGRAFPPFCLSGATITYDLFGRVPVRFTVLRRRAKRWTKLSGGFTHRANEGGNELCFRGRLKGLRLKPGLYRIAAKPRGGRAVARKIRIVR